MAIASTTANLGGGDGGTGPLNFTIPSDFDRGREVQQRILDAVERHAFSSDAQFAIRLALEEALINAIKHGNKLDADKQVKIVARVTDEAAEIEIHDEGAGFDRDDIPDPTLEENLAKCSGRGVLLIEAYMSEAEWTDGGRRLRMLKRNAKEEPAIPD